MSDFQHTDPHTEEFDRDINVRGIVRFGIAVIAAILVWSLISWWISKDLRGRLEATDPAPSVIPEASQLYEPPGPRLQDHPESELMALREHEQAVLTTWQWVDEAGGVAQIPVERAIAILAAEAEVDSVSPPDAAETVGEGPRLPTDTPAGAGFTPSRENEEATE